MSEARTALREVARRIYQQHLALSAGNSRHQAILAAVLAVEPYVFAGDDAETRVAFENWRDRVIILMMDVHRLPTIGETPEVIKANISAANNAAIIQKRQSAMARIASAKTTLGKKLLYHLNKQVISEPTTTVQKAANYVIGLQGAAMSGYNAIVSAELEALTSYHPMNLAFWTLQDRLLDAEKPESNDSIQEIVNFLVDCLKKD